MRKPFVRQDRVAQIVEYPCVPVQVDGGDGMVEVAKRILQHDNPHLGSGKAQVAQREILGNGEILAVARLLKELHGRLPIVHDAPYIHIGAVRPSVDQHVHGLHLLKRGHARQLRLDVLPCALPGELPVSHVSRILPLLFQNGGPFRHLPYLAPHLQRPEQPYGAALSPLSSRGRLRLRFPRGLGRGYGWRRVGRRRNPGTLRLVPVRQKRTDGTPLEEYFVVIIRSKRAGIRQSDENTYCK